MVTMHMHLLCQDTMVKMILIACIRNVTQTDIVKISYSAEIDWLYMYDMIMDYVRAPITALQQLLGVYGRGAD